MIPSERSARSSVRWSGAPRTPDFMLKALPAVECPGLTDDACEAPAGFTALSWPVNSVAPYPVSSFEVLLGSLHTGQPCSTPSLTGRLTRLVSSRWGLL